MGADSAKQLLSRYNQEAYRQFTLNNDQKLSLLSISSVPWISLSDRKDVYKKVSLPQKEGNHVRFITKNDEPDSFLWQTTSIKLKEAVRWGIVRTESLSAKVISALGRYRVIAHERVAKGIVSNTQNIKLKLLDLFQDRFEALQELELLVNKQNSAGDYENAINRYIEQLGLISSELDSRFGSTALSDLDADALEQIRGDIAEDINRAREYLQFIQSQSSLRSVNRSVGFDSVLEFIKQQLSYNLYALQGINQDLTYSSKRTFALTRGEFNDYIADAFKEIDDYKADPRNAQTPSHQGWYDSEEQTLLSYDFSQDNLTPARERQILLAISFIEGWDEVSNLNSDEPIVSNASGSDTLKVIAATNWGSHRDFSTFLKSVGYFLINMLLSFFVYTRPWEEEAWSNNNENFHLVAKLLRQYATPNEPLWHKPVRFFKTLGHAILDIFRGIRDFGAELAFEMPLEIYDDYILSTEMLAPYVVTQQADNELALIRQEEDERLELLLASLKYEVNTSAPIAIQAQPEYHLTAGEANDIITSIVRGLSGFSSLFTHGLYAKDPVAGIAFTATYIIGTVAIFNPAAMAAVLGEGYVNWFQAISYSMGSSKFAAAIAGGSSQAYVVSSSMDLLVHGPNSGVTNLTLQVLEDPLTTASYLAASYVLGHVLVNGVFGYPIPWLSHALRDDMGTIPELNYPILGGKVAFVLYEAFETHESHPYHPKELRYNGRELENQNTHLEEVEQVIRRYRLALWLSENAQDLPKLKYDLRFEIARQIDSFFPLSEAKSLKKILYPEKERSIAFQLFSIPLSYIPAIFRVLVSPGTSLFAWIKGNPYPLQPMIKAVSALGEAIVKDLSRLVIATMDFIHLMYNIVASQIKALAFTVNMFIGRFVGIFNWHPGHAMHKVFASVHVFFDQVGAFFYPAKLIKNTISAHPIHTVKMAEQSYHKLITELGSQISSIDDSAGQVDQDYFISPMHGGEMTQTGHGTEETPEAVYVV